MSNALGELVYRLRRERGLSQAKLAELAGCDNATIQVMEQGRRGWRLGTSRAVIIALDQAAPLAPEDRQKLAALTGVTVGPSAPAVPAPRLERLLHRATDLLGDEAVAAALLAIVASAESDPRDHRVIRTPPVRRPDGAIEHREIDLDTSPPNPAPAAKTKRRAG